MTDRIKLIEPKDELRTIRDTYNKRKLIPSGTTFYAYKVTPKTINFGPNLTLGIQVTDEKPEDNVWWGVRNNMFFPLDCLQLVEE